MVLLVLEIGTGVPVTGTFSSWLNRVRILKTETDQLAGQIMASTNELIGILYLV
jgi:hypothetical protein